MRAAVLLMTDVVGSTRLWAAEHEAMNEAMARHHEIVHSLVAAHGGSRPVDQGEGDAVFAAFTSATAGLACAADVQRALLGQRWSTSVPLSVRIALHVGEVEERSGNLFGDPVNRCARLRGLAAGGQTLVSSALYELVRDRLPKGVELVDLGEHRLKDLARPERVWQLSGVGLDGPFPPLAALDGVRHNLPVQTSTFIGREQDFADLVALVRSSRLVTLTGFGGMGKTRLALQAAAALADGSLGDVWFVDLAAVEDPALVPARVAEVLGLRGGAGQPADALVAALQDSPAVLLLDNLEQVLGCAAFVADLLARAPAVRVLATSREPLHVRGERQVPVPPLRLSAGDVSSESLSTEAVRLFVDRAVSVRPDFVLDDVTAPAVVAVCARLDGLPLALELAAARLNVLTVDKLLVRLDSALSVLTGGARDMPERHRTLRATIAWSYDALSRDEQLLLSRLSVFDGSAAMEMLEDVCGDGLDVLDVVGSLVDKSLVRRADVDGEPRFSLLVSIRQFAAEQLDPTATRGLRDRYADHVARTLNSFKIAASSAYPHRHAWVSRELVHIRFALSHVRVVGSVVDFADLVVALDDTFFHRGLVAEALALAEEALGRVDESKAPLAPERLTTLLVAAAVPRSFLGLPQSDAPRRAIEAARKCSDRGVAAETLANVMSYAARSAEEARALIAELDRALDTLDDTSMIFNDRDNTVALVLRYVDPPTALDAALRMASPIFGPVKASAVLLDRGEWRRALEVLERADQTALTGQPNPTWASRIAASRARALAHAGRLVEARAAAEETVAIETSIGVPPLLGGIVLTEVEWRADDAAGAVRVSDDVLSRCAPDTLSSQGVVRLLWRRAVALAAVGRHAEAADLLPNARDVFAASELYGPRELLGVLVARAGEVADVDPARAAELLASVHAHRGNWVLPFAMDARLDQLLKRLPIHHGAVPHPTEAW
ncbi:MAG TPA: adenylate/guanylate cyclase domain-containing protein [Mycobacteriales bacterium]|nr:adenylate/guanylate cyclase domain-containing protein [Mycobacteriales bacterium]